MALFKPRKKEARLPNIYDVFRDIHRLLKQKKHGEAKQKYNMILKVYNNLSNSEKKRVYFHLKKLYEKINLS